MKKVLGILFVLSTTIAFGQNRYQIEAMKFADGDEKTERKDWFWSEFRPCNYIITMQGKFIMINDPVKTTVRTTEHYMINKIIDGYQVNSWTAFDKNEIEFTF